MTLVVSIFLDIYISNFKINVCAQWESEKEVCHQNNWMKGREREVKREITKRVGKVFREDSYPFFQGVPCVQYRFPPDFSSY